MTATREDPQFPTVRDVLRDPGAFDLGHALFAAKPVERFDAECLVLDPDDVEDDADDEPAAARAAGFRYVLGMDDVDGIVANLRAQVADPSDALRLDALRFYLTRDAFLAVVPCLRGASPAKEDWAEIAGVGAGTISRAEFLARHPELTRDPDATVGAGIAAARARQDGDLLEYTLLVGRLYELRAVATPTLAELLGEDWHTRHEDIVRELQARRDPATAPALVRAVRHVPPYLVWDDNRALAVKALHGLEDIGTPEARRALREFAEDPDPVVSATARRMVARDRPPKPPRPLGPGAPA